MSSSSRSESSDKWSSSSSNSSSSSTTSSSSGASSTGSNKRRRTTSSIASSAASIASSASSLLSGAGGSGAVAAAAAFKRKKTRRRRKGLPSQAEEVFLKPADRQSHGKKKRQRDVETRKGQLGTDALSPALGHEYRPALALMSKRKQAAARAERKRVLQTKKGFDHFLAELGKRWGQCAFELELARGLAVGAVAAAVGGGGGGGAGQRRRPLTPVELVRLARVEWAELSAEQKAKYCKRQRKNALLPALVPPSASIKPPATVVDEEEVDSSAAHRSLEALCPGCPPRPAANALALLMRRHGLNIAAARAMLAGMPPGQAAAVTEEVRTANARYIAELRAYCGRKSSPLPLTARGKGTRG